MNSGNKPAVLLLAHGSPASADEVPEYLKFVTSGRPLPSQVVEEIKHRYSLVGSSPLTCWTMQQGDQLARDLHMPVYIAMRNWKPFIAEVLTKMAADGVTHAIAICLAPQNSRTSVGLYRKAIENGGPITFPIDFVQSWHNHPLLIKAFAEKFAVAWQSACVDAGSEVPVVFTAHSVPERTIVEGDPYRDQAHETAELVARSADLKNYDFAFQSQGMSGGPWIGPTVEDTITKLNQQGHRAVFVDPIGFLCDHVEVLYDIDIGFKEYSAKLGMRLWRAESLNGSSLLTEALADITRARLQAVGAA